MQPSQTYLVVSIAVLAIVAIVLLLVKKQKPEKKLSRLAAISFVFIIMGMFFGDNRVIGYSFFAIGILIAVADIVKKGKG